MSAGITRSTCNCLPSGLLALLFTMIALKGVSKEYPGGHVALQDVSLQVPRGETLALLGPSGCGKTTTLRLINRLIEASSGQVLVDDSDISDLDPIELRRGIGYVVQEAALFPHMSARENIETVPRLLKWPADQRRERTRALFDLIRLSESEYSGRYPSQMSGGERQRVGLARALAADPPIVLMDEPYSALDPITRRQLHDHFLQLKAELGKTMVLVTHDVDEALRLADRVAVLGDGRVAQIGRVEELRNAATDSPIGMLVQRG